MFRIRSEIHVRKLKYVAMVLIAVLLSMMFHVNSYDNMDFVRHSSVMDYIKSSNISLNRFLLNSDMINKNETSSNTYVFNVLEYFFANTFDNNYVFVWFLTAIDYSIIAYIAYDNRAKKGYRLEEILFAISFCFVFLPFVHVVSGLRSANAMCLTALGIYLLYYKKIYVFPGLLFTMAFMIHSVIIIPSLVAIVVYLFPYKLTSLLFGVAFLFVNIFISIVSMLNNPFLQSMVKKYYTYTGDNQFTGYKFAYYGCLLFSILYLCYYIIFHFFSIKRSSNNKLMRLSNNKLITLISPHLVNNIHKDKMYLFLATYCVVIICNFNGHEFVNRLSYLMGCFAPIVSNYFFEPRSDENEAMISMNMRIMVYGVIFIMVSLNIFHYYRFFL